MPLPSTNFVPRRTTSTRPSMATTTPQFYTKTNLGDLVEYSQKGGSTPAAVNITAAETPDQTGVMTAP